MSNTFKNTIILLSELNYNFQKKLKKLWAWYITQAAEIWKFLSPNYFNHMFFPENRRAFQDQFEGK